MSFSNIIGLLTHPNQEWTRVREDNSSTFKTYFTYIIFLALIPPVCGYIGTTKVGWSLSGSSEVVLLTKQSAGFMCVMSYFAILVGIYIMGCAINWMSKTYESNPSVSKCIVFTSHTTSPLLVSGFIGLYPSIWVMVFTGLAAATWSVYLLYSGIPIFMGINKEQGFIFASAIVCMALVSFVAILASTVIFWSIGVGPEYIHITY